MSCLDTKGCGCSEEDLDFNDNREDLGWNLTNGGRKGELCPGQRAWQVMSEGPI